MFARLVTGRYGAMTEDERLASNTARTSWLRRMIASIFGSRRG